MPSMKTPDKKAPASLSGYVSDIHQSGPSNIRKYISNSNLQQKGKSIDPYAFPRKKEG